MLTSDTKKEYILKGTKSGIPRTSELFINKYGYQPYLYDIHACRAANRKLSKSERPTKVEASRKMKGHCSTLHSWSIPDTTQF